MSDSSSRSSLRWHTLLVVGLTAGLLWWFLRSLDFANVGRAIASANAGMIVLAIVVTLQTYLIRTWRWQVLLLPVGRPSFRAAFRTTVIGFAATFLLPGRVGEVLRPYLLARQEGFSAAATLATVIIERILDMVTVLLLFGCYLLTSSADVGPEVTFGGAVAAGIAIAVLAVMAISAGHPERIGRWTSRATRLLPGRAASLAAQLAQGFVEGLAVMRRPGAFLWAMLLSVPLWLSLALGVWLTTRAFDLTLPFTGTFLVMVFLTVGIAMPTPAGMGGFHKMYQLAMMTFFGAGADPAAAAAIVLHAVSIVPVSLLGLVFMAQEGLSLGRLKGIRSAAEAAGGKNAAGL